MVDGTFLGRYFTSYLYYKRFMFVNTLFEGRIWESVNASMFAMFLLTRL